MNVNLPFSDENICIIHAHIICMYIIYIYDIYIYIIHAVSSYSTSFMVGQSFGVNPSHQYRSRMIGWSLRALHWLGMFCRAWLDQGPSMGQSVLQSFTADQWPTQWGHMIDRRLWRPYAAVSYLEKVRFVIHSFWQKYCQETTITFTHPKK